jgi:prepilin-type N-terminal cleavage/methylation domain-containing protein
VQLVRSDAGDPKLRICKKSPSKGRRITGSRRKTPDSEHRRRKSEGCGIPGSGISQQLTHDSARGDRIELAIGTEDSTWSFDVHRPPDFQHPRPSNPDQLDTAQADINTDDTRGRARDGTRHTSQPSTHWEKMSGRKSRGVAKRRVARCTPPGTLGNAHGFTAIELLAVLAVIAVVSTTYLALQRPTEMIPVEGAAQRLAGHIEEARDGAVASEGEALIAVLPDGRYAALHGPSGSLALDRIDTNSWDSLPAGLLWGSGSAGTDPLGQAPAAMPAQVFCDADGACSTPTPAAVYLVRSSREPHRVAAVTLDPGGAIQVWRWEDGTQQWRPLSR